MRPTRRAIVLAALGLPVALLPVAVHVRLWPFWPVYLGLMALAMGFDALWAPRRRDVACSVEMPGTLYIGEEEEAVLTVSVPSTRRMPVAVAVDLSDRLVPQPPLRGRIAAGSGRAALPAGPHPARADRRRARLGALRRPPRADRHGGAGGPQAAGAGGPQHPAGQGGGAALPRPTGSSAPA